MRKGKHRDRETEGQRARDWETAKMWQRERKRETERQKRRERERETDRQTNGETERQTERERKNVFVRVGFIEIEIVRVWRDHFGFWGLSSWILI